MFKRLLKFILVLVFPKFSYTNLRKLDSNDAYKDYLVRLDTHKDDFIDKASNNFLHNYFKTLDYKSCLEIGSGVGNRIIPLALENPEREFAGLDINEFAIKIGSEYCSINNIRNLKLFHANLLEIDPKDFTSEIVLSWATLIYISPRDINKAISNLAVLSKQYLILVEKVVDTHNSVFKKIFIQLKGFPNWSHDYEQLLRRHSFQLINCDPIPMNIWYPGGGGAKILIFRKASIK